MSKTIREQLASRRASLEAGEEPAPMDQETEVEIETPEEPIEENATEETSVEEPIEEVSGEETATEEPVAAAGTETPATEAFTPEFKYRADGKDLEVPDYLRTLIKDKDSQEKVVNMLKKHDAFDTVSTRRDQFRTERDEARSRVSNFETAISTMRNTYQRGDIDGFLKLCEIPEDQMLKWATEKAKYLMGDEHYRRQIDQDNTLRQTAWSKDSQANEYQSKYQEMEARQLQTEFNYEMMKPEVSSFAESFDKFAGKQGAFIEEIKNRGELAYLREQKTIAPSEVIQSIMKQYSTVTQAAQKPPVAGSNGPAAKVVVKPTSKVATIPTVRGTSASPTKEGFTSLDDVRKYRKEIYGK